MTVAEVRESGLKTVGMDFAAHQARHRTEDRPWSILDKSELSAKFPKLQDFANKWFELEIGYEWNIKHHTGLGKGVFGQALKSNTSRTASSGWMSHFVLRQALRSKFS